MKIEKLNAREILDSRGNPTIEAVAFGNGHHAAAAVPSGASTGSHEALELRDRDEKRFDGLGVMKAVANVKETIANAVVGKEFVDVTQLDAFLLKLDDSPKKTNLGANSLLAVSLAFARLDAENKGQHLYEYLAKTYGFGPLPKKMPRLMMNVINGGSHADTQLEIQEFHIVPRQDSALEMVRVGAEVFHALKQVLKRQKKVTLVGDEGGYAPEYRDGREVLAVMQQAVELAGYIPGKDVDFSIDAAATELFDIETGKYRLNEKTLSATQLISVYRDWIKEFPIISLEDGLAEDDFEGWKKLKQEFGEKMTLVGDDLFVTNLVRLEEGIKEDLANAILIKPNQIGTLTEAVQAIQRAQKEKMAIVISHRSGETCDPFITDLAVASHANYLKAGSLSRGERLTKYNRLMAIDDLLHQTGA
ncbi:MAG: phosphopyruvate hydratase [Patescibacteria group bacterium]|jgi:enolase